MYCVQSMLTQEKFLLRYVPMIRQSAQRVSSQHQHVSRGACAGEHMLLQRVCAPLTVTSAGRVPPQKFPEMAAQLRLLRDYIAASADPAIAATLLEEGGPCLQQIHVRMSSA